MRFQQGDVESRQGGAGAVQGVTEDILPALIFIAQVHASRLEIFKIAARRHFQPVLQTGRPDFDVVALGRTETEIAGAEGDDAVVKLEVGQHAFGVGDERFELRVRVLGFDDVDELHFVELVNADHAARVLARAARFAAETGRVGGVVNGEMLFGEDFLAVQIGHRHFGGGNKKKVFALDAVHVLFKFRELAGADHALAAHHEGRGDFGVTVFAGVEVEEVIEERPFEPRARATVNDEAAAGNLRGLREIEHPFFLADFPMGQRLEGEGDLFADLAHDGIVVRIDTDGNALVRHVVNLEEEIVLRFFDGGDFDIEFRDAVGNALHLRLDFLGGGLVALGHESADLLAGGVAFALERFDLLEQLAALLVLNQKGVDVNFVTTITGGEPGADFLRFFAYNFDVEHGKRNSLYESPSPRKCLAPVLIGHFWSGSCTGWMACYRRPIAMDYYESDLGVAEYLLFHYGTLEQTLSFRNWPGDGHDYPTRCVREGLAGFAPPPKAELVCALDVGCSVGRGSFELARTCDKVVAIDLSKRFIATAQQIQRDGFLDFDRVDEGDRTTRCRVAVSPEIDRARVRFEVGDALQLPASLGMFDVVFAANLIDRLPKPAQFIARCKTLVKPGGILVLSSPYTWLEAHAPREEWLGGQIENNSAVPTWQKIADLLQPEFTLRRRHDLPFLLREHSRKFQWSIAELTVFGRAK